MNNNTKPESNGQIDCKVMWLKQCKCSSTSTTNRTIINTKHDIDKIITTLTFYPQPVCDECDTPWIKST